MLKGKHIVYIILISIPVAVMLFLLAVINVLLMLMALIAILLGILLLKQYKPDIFGRSEEIKKEQQGTIAPQPRPEKLQTYMVLTNQSIFDEQRIIVNKTYFRIGRNPDNDYVLDGANVSRYHMRIEYNEIEGMCYAIDTDSVNHTYLNSEQMISGQRYRIIQGDRIIIDNRTFVAEYAHF